MHFRQLSYLSACALLLAGAAGAQDKPVYRCPGPPVLYTDAMTPQEAKDKNCRAIEGTPVTVVPATRPRPPANTSAANNPANSANSASRPADARVDPAEQRARDSDRRRILVDELRMEEERMVVLRKDFNNGEPERRGDERNFQKYQERVGEMRAALQRKESDIAALKRELGKLPP